MKVLVAIFNKEKTLVIVGAFSEHCKFGEVSFDSSNDGRDVPQLSCKSEL